MKSATWSTSEGSIRLERGDCLERMAELPAGSVDLVLADLPYGMTACKWDSVIPFGPLWTQYQRVLRPRGAVVLTASQPFTAALVMSNPAWFRYEWIWRKEAPTGFLDARRKPLKEHESILVFSEKAPRYFPQGLIELKQKKTGTNSRVYGRRDKEFTTTHTQYPRTVLHFARDRPRTHPTQKPVALVEYLVRTYTRPGETVLDNTMGSGTTGVACVHTGRRFVGIERDAAYFELALGRIQQALANAAHPAAAAA